jgi:3-hydroxy acid dehydrogenase / malonic semialdehyde reductase
MAIVLVTGATSGFGEACAKKFAANGYDLIITGRRQERLTALQQQLQQEHNISVLPLCFDVRDQQAVNEILGNIPDKWKAVNILINNAGLALGLSTIEDGDLSDWDAMIDTNVKGLLYVSRVVMPWMKKARTGHIINLGSTAAKQVYAKGHVYCATKAAVDSISQGMRIDLLPFRIKVTAVHPGAAETEFSEVRFKGDKEMANNVYKGFQPLKPADIADTIYYCATLPPHVCINDLVITCVQQANAYYFDKE